MRVNRKTAPDVPRARVTALDAYDVKTMECIAQNVLARGRGGLARAPREGVRTMSARAKVNLASIDYRRRLPLRKEPYWQRLANGVVIGYRSSNETWHVRLTRHGRREKRLLGHADTNRSRDGETALDYRDACKRALAIADSTEASAPRSGLSYTIRDACSDYLEWFKANSKSLDHAEGTIQRWILPKLGDRLVSDLTIAELADWHHGIARSKARLRSRTVARFRTHPEGMDPDEIQRRRKSTANRNLSVLKAALTYADRFRALKTSKPWQEVKPFRDVDRARIRFLSEPESKRLLNACDPDFRPVVHAALLTGARYGSIVAMRVEDFSRELGTVYVRKAKTTKSQKHVPLTAEGIALFEEATAGKLGTDYVFLKKNGKPWHKSEQNRRMQAACETSKIAPRATFHNLKDTFVSHLVKRGVPFAYISEITGTSIRTLEKYYAHLAESDVRQILESNSMKLGAKPAKVAAIR